jgi:hypothetical protein
MPTPLPRNAGEAGYLGFSFAAALIDILIEKKVITESEFASFLDDIAQRLEQETNVHAKQTSEFVRNVLMSRIGPKKV